MSEYAITEEEIETTLKLLAKLKEVKAATDNSIKEANAVLVKAAEERESKSVEVGKRKYTVVASERISFDNQILKNILSAKQWKAISVRKADQSKIEAAVTSGLVQVTDIKEAMSVSKSAPYVRITSAKVTIGE